MENRCGNLTRTGFFFPASPAFPYIPSMEIPHSELSRHPIHTQSVNGLEYAYIDKGEGPVLFFLHGFPDLAGTWDDAIDVLSAEYRCIAPFLRGYYPSALAPDNNYDSPTIGRDIAALAVVLGIEEYTVIGHDWGASVAYSLANLEPERVTKLVTLGIPHPRFIKLTIFGLWRARHFIRFRKPESSVDYSRKNDYAYIGKLMRRWAPNWKGYGPTFELVRRTFKLEGRLEAALGYYWSFQAGRNDKERARIVYRRPKMQVLTFAGKTDGGISTKGFLKMKEDLGDQVRLRIHETAGHWVHREAPDYFVKELKAFLAEG